MRTLHDPRVKSGVNRIDAMNFVREVIIPELIVAYERHGEEGLYQQ